jgi:hypothetical protein
VFSTHDGDISAVRVTSDGTIRDAPPLWVANAAELEISPTLVGTATGWVVAWIAGSKVQAAQVNLDGKIEPLKSPAWDAPQTEYNQLRLTAACDGAKPGSRIGNSTMSIDVRQTFSPSETTS